MSSRGAARNKIRVRLVYARELPGKLNYEAHFTRHRYGRLGLDLLRRLPSNSRRARSARVKTCESCPSKVYRSPLSTAQPASLGGQIVSGALGAGRTG